MTVAEFRARTIMPQGDVDALEDGEPGFLQTILDDWSNEIDARLRKRYATPFVAPIPPTILRWLTKLATRDAYGKRGYDPSNKSDVEAIQAAAERCEVELKEAADAKDGLFDLPLREDRTGSGVGRGGPLAYTESSPYRWQDIQKRAASREDSNR